MHGTELLSYWGVQTPTKPITDTYRDNSISIDSLRYNNIAERQLCSRRGLTGDADAAARTAPVGRDGMCTPASRLGPQGGSGRGRQKTFGPVLSYPVKS